VIEVEHVSLLKIVVLQDNVLELDETTFEQDVLGREKVILPTQTDSLEGAVNEENGDVP
jgi:hypothetical protein